MVWYVRRQAFAGSRRLLKEILAVSVILFIFFAYSLYSYEFVLTSPGEGSYALGNFLLWAFVIGMIIALVVISVIIYIFIHEHEN
ncbi:MAG: hypothetical protein AABY16_04420 [Nanoarchaeota archaeon]